MRRCMMGTCVLLCCAAAWSQETQDAARQSCPSETIGPLVKWPLADAPKLPLRTYTLDELAARFSAFKHEPAESAGFNHLTLPFRYLSTKFKDAGYEALAFSFLLSNAMDWADGCYCARHAYFTFKRSRSVMLPMRQQYDRRIIAQQIEEWEATHAIGGLLRRTNAGYSGILEVYDRSGEAILILEYSQPRDYFELLGDMAADAMRSLGYQPSEALVRHLKKKRCRDFQSIRDLGAAAFAAEKSNIEFGLYKRILHRDPAFAEVRYWYFNQKQWKDDNREDYILNMSRAMEDYLVESALTDLADEDAPYPAFSEKFGRWVDQAQELVGPEHPSILLIKLYDKHVKRTDEDIELAEKVVGRYPNCHWLLRQLGHIHYHKRKDPYMGASMYIAGLRNRFLPSMGHKRDFTLNLGSALYDLGHYAEAHSVLLPLWETRFDTCFSAYGCQMIPHALKAAGWLPESIAAQRRIYDALDKTTSYRSWVLVDFAITAAIHGDEKVLSQVVLDKREEVGSVIRILDAYLEASQGKQVDLGFEKDITKLDNWHPIKLFRVLAAQLDLLAGKSQCRRSIEEGICWDPFARELWLLIDMYDRRDPSPQMASFYSAIEWLFPHDEWVRQASADYRQRVTDPVFADAQQLLKELEEYKTVRWPVRPERLQPKASPYFWHGKAPPFWAAAAIRRLIEQGDYDRAHELALRHHYMCVQTLQDGLITQANWMIHLVELARDEAGATPASEPATRP
ncbi:MAG: hypothetical protein GXY38_13340 [Planctomycetes bacterium]|jgi:hypothetical protein|nr:hypothetical protein [Planctomycetota bacterium]